MIEPLLLERILVSLANTQSSSLLTFRLLLEDKPEDTKRTYYALHKVETLENAIILLGSLNHDYEQLQTALLEAQKEYQAVLEEINNRPTQLS
ncbi:hypothetical protein [Siphonobacter sp.]|uniref:hypothetical protein n=1 Tax=Siphonobacter sp. TaxID=1869184 RepID=UPI003B3BC488